jgi:hypothetical protein
MKLKAKTTPGELQKALKELEKPIAHTATVTIKQAAQIVKKESAAEISRAGFSARSSKNVRYTLDPERGESIDISATFKFRTGYFNIFEEGGSIQGKPLLWIPMDNVPFASGRKRLTAKQYTERIGPLFRTKSDPPYLVGRVSRAGVTRATRDVVKLRKRAVRTGTLRTKSVPLYVGVRSVTIPKKFDIKGVVQRVAARIPQLYLENAEKVNKQ